MKTSDLIRVQTICECHQVEVSFINSLDELGLIEIVVTKDDHYLPQTQLHEVEKMIRLHHELHINLEGIDTIYHLLRRITILEEALNGAKNKLRAFNII